MIVYSLYLFASPIVAWFLVILYAMFFREEGNVLVEYLVILGVILVAILAGKVNEIRK